MARQSAEKLPEGGVSQEVAELHAEIERLKQAHTLELRQLEIASYKAELELATDRRNDPMSKRNVSAGHDQFKKTIFFRADGRPKKFIRLFLFESSGRPRPLFKRIIFKKSGIPRRNYVPWMKSSKYQSLPQAYRWSR